MKNISENMAARLQQNITTLAFCWKLSFADGEVKGFTSHDEDIKIADVTYKSRTGFTLDGYKAELGETENLAEVFGIIDSEDISEQDIRSGRVDNAVLEIFMLDYNDVEAGSVLVKKGQVSRITDSGGRYILGITGALDRLENNITEIYSPLCRARFGDTKCGKNIGEFTFTGMIEEVLNERTLFDSARTEEKNYFDRGVIKFTSGANSGFSTEVKRYENGRIWLSIPFPSPIQAGDEYEISAGCNKKFSTCSGRFNNAVNFRGEPHIPGIDKVFKIS